MIEGLTAKMGAVEKIVREGWKEDQTKAGSSTDVPEANNLMETKLRRTELKKAETTKAKLRKANKAAETVPKPNRMTTRAKA
ncbi:unnamed protein product [Brassica napus]|uniref:(rape) hypothetical protein n=1 Tax=Brassica napus TaxID=3708 RepID=A0A816LDY0_BRANA|nr:unnamed protein product [Brassica napus]